MERSAILRMFDVPDELMAEGTVNSEDQDRAARGGPPDLTRLLVDHFPSQTEFGDIECSCHYRFYWTNDSVAANTHPYGSPGWHWEMNAAARAWAAHVQSVIDNPLHAATDA